MLRVDGTGVGDVVLGWGVSVMSLEGNRDIPVPGSTPKRSAICAILSGLKVPSVSVTDVSVQDRLEQVMFVTYQCTPPCLQHHPYLLVVVQ